MRNTSRVALEYKRLPHLIAFDIEQLKHLFQHTFIKVNDTEQALAAAAYLTFIAIIHQVYIQQCLTHTCTHHHTTYYRQHYSFSTNYRRFLDVVPKNAPEELIKTVTDPDPGPSFIFFFFTTKWKREWRSVFQDTYTPLRTLKQSPSLGFFQGGIKTKQTEGKTGLGWARGQAQWFRQLGSPFLRCRLYNLLPNTGWSSSFGIQPPGQR